MWKGRTIRKIVAVVLAVLMTGMLLTACTENKNGSRMRQMQRIISK